MSKKALGKGIEALLQTNKGKATQAAATEVDIDLIKPNPKQPRKVFYNQSLNELASSIKQKGIIQPIIVEQDPKGGYIIIAGERRYRAAKIANLTKIPVIIKSFSEAEKVEISLIENIQREDLTPIEEAEAYQSLINFFNLSQEELATHLGKNRSTIANSLRLLKLPPPIKNALNERLITAGHARAILSLDDVSSQYKLYKRIVDSSLSVREAEKMSLKLNTETELPAAEKSPPLQKEPELEEIKQKFIDTLGTKIEIKGTLKKGKIQISYFSADDLERIYYIITKQ